MPLCTKAFWRCEEISDTEVEAVRNLKNRTLRTSHFWFLRLLEPYKKRLAGHPVILNSN